MFVFFPCSPNILVLGAGMCLKYTGLLGFVTCCFSATKRRDEAEEKPENSIWRWREKKVFLSFHLFPFFSWCRFSMSLFSQLSAAAYVDRPCISAAADYQERGVVWWQKLLATVVDQWQRSGAIILFVCEVLGDFWSMHCCIFSWLSFFQRFALKLARNSFVKSVCKGWNKSQLFQLLTFKRAVQWFLKGAVKELTFYEFVT